jgi:beta-phosphoglucomutase-like phosphatase (HAD superfamily)
MTPEAFLSGRKHPLRLVIFDCDGVIVDSESIANRIIAQEMTALGWEITAAEADRLFLGMTLPDMMPIIERQIGRKLPEGWRDRIRAEFITVLGDEVTPIDGAVGALDGVSALGLPWRVASNSSHEEMRVKFARIGVSERVAGRIHSHRDVGHGKPAPDLFLATAAAEGVPPSECVVIEDSLTGARAAAAAGMDCLAYVPHGDGAALRAVGAIPFRSMYDLPALIGLAPRGIA